MLSLCTMLFTKYKLALPYMPQPKLWWSTLSSLSFGWSAPSPSSSTWGTGADSTQPPASPEAKVGDQSFLLGHHEGRSIYKSFRFFFGFMLRYTHYRTVDLKPMKCLIKTSLHYVSNK